jgi:hypothetical protein
MSTNTRGAAKSPSRKSSRLASRKAGAGPERPASAKSLSSSAPRSRGRSVVPTGGVPHQDKGSPKWNWAEWLTAAGTVLLALLALAQFAK